MEFEHNICEEVDLEDDIFIQCENCIDYASDKLTNECSCKYKTVRKIICRKCYNIKNKINGLKDEVDKILYELSYNIKNYIDCQDLINDLEKKSILLRQYNRLLLDKKNNDF
jgi:hypothetical protein